MVQQMLSLLLCVCRRECVCERACVCVCVCVRACVHACTSAHAHVFMHKHNLHPCIPHLSSMHHTLTLTPAPTSNKQLSSPEQACRPRTRVPGWWWWVGGLSIPPSLPPFRPFLLFLLSSFRLSFCLLFTQLAALAALARALFSPQASRRCLGARVPRGSPMAQW